jgi:hypothetical protein
MQNLRLSRFANEPLKWRCRRIPQNAMGAQAARSCVHLTGISVSRFVTDLQIPSKYSIAFAMPDSLFDTPAFCSET